MTETARQTTTGSYHAEVRFAARPMPSSTTASPGNSTLVEFPLTPEDGGTRLRVLETGHDGLGWPQDQANAFVDDHNEGWSWHLGRLEQLYTRRSADATR
jgi:hypothetical protein